MKENTIIISLKNITKKYNKKTILKKINLDIYKSDFVVIKGLSGSGKTTLLNIIGLLDTYNNGDYFFNNKKIKRMSRNKIRKNNIGFVFQSYCLIDSLSAIDNVLLPYLYRDNIKGCFKMAEEILGNLNLLSIKDSQTKNLSGGEKQRIAIARALIINPEIIIADEPTGNLDDENTEIIVNAFKKLCDEGKTVVVVTHSNKFDRVASEIYTIKEGELVV